MARVSSKTRQNLPSSAFADTEDRKFLIHDKSHALMAWRMLDRAQFPSEESKTKTKTKILSALKRFGIDTSEYNLSSDMSDKEKCAMQDILECDMAHQLEPDEMEEAYSQAYTDSYDETHFLKIPVARLGTWYHPKYGIVQFSQNDFNQMIDNFENDELGFPPYMRYGHDTGEIGVVDDEPSRGYITCLSQEGSILYSYVVPTDLGAASDVQEQRMRFASAELVRRMPSKTDGSNLGTVLTAIALTNSPYVPNLPEAEVLSQSEEGFFVLDLSKEKCAMCTEEEVCASCKPEEKMSCGVCTEEEVCKDCESSTEEYASKTEAGVAHPSSHYAYVPEADKPSTWKLLIHDKAHVAAASAALGPGFRGQKVSLPSEDRAKVVAKVRSAWKKFNSDKSEEDMPEVLKMSNNSEGLMRKLYDEFTQFFGMWKTAQEPEVQVIEEAAVEEVVIESVEMLSEEITVSEEVTQEPVEELSQTAALEERLAALEAEKAALAEQLTNTKAQADEAEKAAELLSSALNQQKLETLKADLISKGIPPVMVEQAFSLVSAMPTDKTVKLSNGNDGSLVEKMAEVLESLPQDNRVQLGQVGHALSNTNATENPYKDIINRRLGK